jgi:hypothetical protein
MTHGRAIRRAAACIAGLAMLASVAPARADVLARERAFARGASPLALVLEPVAPAPVALGGFVATLPRDEPLALSTAFAPAPDLAVRVSGGKAGPKPRKPGRPRRNSNLALTPERAQALLRSMTVPGWGQATLGHRTAGAVFATIETGIWGSFVAFRIQEQLRRDAAARTARIFAGIDLHGRDEEFLRIVGAFASSDEYNRLVVMRDAANLYYDNPAAYREYIAKNSLSGGNAWSWLDEASFLRYGAQRKDSQRAGLRANTALALAIANRLVSILHVARIAGTRPAPGARSWNFEVVPAGGQDPTAFRCGVRTSF